MPMGKDKIPGVRIGNGVVYDALAQYQGEAPERMLFIIQHMKRDNPNDTRTKQHWHCVRTMLKLSDALAMITKIRQNVPSAKLRMCIMSEGKEMP